MAEHGRMSLRARVARLRAEAGSSAGARSRPASPGRWRPTSSGASYRSSPDRRRGLARRVLRPAAAARGRGNRGGRPRGAARGVTAPCVGSAASRSPSSSRPACRSRCSSTPASCCSSGAVQGSWWPRSPRLRRRLRTVNDALIGGAVALVAASSSRGAAAQAARPAAVVVRKIAELLRCAADRLGDGDVDRALSMLREPRSTDVLIANSARPRRKVLSSSAPRPFRRRHGARQRRLRRLGRPPRRGAARRPRRRTPRGRRPATASVPESYAASCVSWPS